MNNQQIAELKKLAEAATPGPWEALPEEADRNYIRIRGTQLGLRYKIANVNAINYEGAGEWEHEETRANAAYIAAANPQAILSLIERLEHTQQWYAERHERLWHWAHENLSEELRQQYFNIVANGTADSLEPPTYAQQLNMANYRAEKAEAAQAPLLARIAELEKQNGELQKDADRLDLVIDQELRVCERTGGFFLDKDTDFLVPRERYLTGRDAIDAAFASQQKEGA